ncbi:MAG: nucleotidyltransferase family protein [Ktedonobacterales bacterium]
MPDTSLDGRALAALTPERILDILKEHQTHLQALGVRSLGLFGSFRRGTPHAASDLDFLLVLQRPSFSDYMAVTFFLEDLFGRPVDLALAESLKPRLREHILSEVLYAEGLSPVS